MRLNAGLLREIVLRIEDEPDRVDWMEFVGEGHTKNEVGYHLSLLKHSGLLNVSFIEADNDPYYSVSIGQLTMDGHEFAANVRSSSVWRDVMRAIKKVGGSVSVAVLKEVVEASVLGRLGL